MEYSRSVGDCYESFEGTPQEIAALVAALEPKRAKLKFRMPEIKLPDLSKSVK